MRAVDAVATTRQQLAQIERQLAAEQAKPATEREPYVEQLLVRWRSRYETVVAYHLRRG